MLEGQLGGVKTVFESARTSFQVLYGQAMPRASFSADARRWPAPSPPHSCGEEVWLAALT